MGGNPCIIKAPSEMMAGKYDRLRLIGKGSFGEAWLVKTKDTKLERVIKEIKLSSLSEKEIDLALTEVTVLASCKNPNIISYYEAFVVDGLLHVVMEYAEKGDLQKQIQEQRGIHFEEEVILFWFVQICYALKYIHGQNILHRDLKTPNIFLCAENVVKIGDFGIARLLESSRDQAMTTIGTPYYFSPEICNKKPYNQKSDMWAVGCVLYELCSFHVPFSAQDYGTLIVKISTGDYKPIPSHYGPLLEDLVNVLLKPNPDDRPSADEVLAIPKMDIYVEKYIAHQKKIERKRRAMSSPSVISDMIKQRCTPCTKQKNGENRDNPTIENKPDTPTRLGYKHTGQVHRIQQLGINSPKSTRALHRYVMKTCTPGGVPQKKVPTGPTPMPKFCLMKEMHQARSHSISGHSSSSSAVPFTNTGTPKCRRSTPGSMCGRTDSASMLKSSLSKSMKLNQSLSSQFRLPSSLASTISDISASTTDESSSVFETEDDRNSDRDSDKEVDLEERISQMSQKKSPKFDDDHEQNGDVSESDSTDVDMNNNETDKFDSELDPEHHEPDRCDVDFEEIFKVMYEASRQVKTSPYSAIESLSSFLEDALGFEKFFRCSKKIKDALEKDVLYPDLGFSLTGFEKTYAPLMIHLATLEQIDANKKK